MTFRINNFATAAAVFLMALMVACTKPASNATADVGNQPVVETAAADASSAESPEMVRGKRVFASCASCHTLNRGAASTIGPNLYGVLGSTAGRKQDFAYSQAMKDSGVVWTEESLDSYVANPMAFIPGGLMAFAGVADKADREAVIAYVIAMSDDDGSELALPSDQGDDVAVWE